VAFSNMCSSGNVISRVVRLFEYAFSSIIISNSVNSLGVLLC
jgi:hypothetical protein